MTTEKIIKKIDDWIIDSEKISETLTQKGMEEEAKIFNNYAQAYWNVKQFINVNKK